MIIIDATDLIVGRLATYAAKQTLLGKEVRIINSEKAIISGKKENTFQKYLDRRHKGTHAKGPFIHRRSERILRRAIRGMVPFKTARGREAYKRVLCYTGVPDEFKNMKPVELKSISKSKLPNLKYITLLQISERLGAKVE
ncbi:MAG: 50S ribosomal protein L13 [Nanoarchaeota archaeon]